MRISRRNAIIATVAMAGAIGTVSGPAWADSIDGDWCNGTMHFEITGGTILTPGRNKAEGRNGHYSFAYVVPANEPGAGTEIKMVFVRPEMVHLTRAGQTGAPEVWRRCKPIS